MKNYECVELDCNNKVCMKENRCYFCANNKKAKDNPDMFKGKNNGNYKDGRKLCAHHIDYNKLNNNPQNLISLCDSCHSITNFNREYWEQYFKILIVKKIQECEVRKSS